MNQYDKAYAEYCRLPHVMIDPLDLPEDIGHMVYRARHEIDLVEEGERDDDDDKPTAAELKAIKQFVKKWSK